VTHQACSHTLLVGLGAVREEGRSPPPAIPIECRSLPLRCLPPSFPSPRTRFVRRNGSARRSLERSTASDACQRPTATSLARGGEVDSVGRRRPTDFRRKRTPGRWKIGATFFGCSGRAVVPRTRAGPYLFVRSCSCYLPDLQIEGRPANTRLRACSRRRRPLPRRRFARLGPAHHLRWSLAPISQPGGRQTRRCQR
jgi:hypothetical protein